MQIGQERPYRLGIDVGSNSLGWFVVWLDGDGKPTALGPGGVRIFPDGRDPQSKSSNAVERRVARGARRRRDRYLKRRSNLMSLLIRCGLMPVDEPARKGLEHLDPYEMRAKALDDALPAYHVGRALFHLNQRRGFLSNRKTEKVKDSEAGAIKLASGRLSEMMREAGARTLGEYFYGRQRTRQPVRARNRSTGLKAEYDFYPTRQMLLDEFNAIWDAQAIHLDEMTPAARDAISHAIFDQRPLKQPPVGKCSLDPAQSIDDREGFRCSWAHPLAQRFRIWQEVRNLAVAETGKASKALTREQGNAVALALFQTAKFSFDKIRALLKLPPEAKFNLESDKRDALLGDETAAKLSGKSFFGKAWRALPLTRQIEIAVRIFDAQDPIALKEWLTAEAGLDEPAADRTASTFLPDGHSRLGLRAIKNILPYMEGGMNYPDAAKASGYDHALLPTGEVSPNGYLPYYGEWLQDDVLGSGDPEDTNDKRWGRFPNPTVHIGLGQLRRVVNALIREYGPPAEIAVEMTRAFKLSPKQLAELEKEQAENQHKNEARRDELRKLGMPDTSLNLTKLRLWEELNARDPLDRRCPFSGEVINIARLFSDEVEIEHLIPFQDSWDDSAANKLVCMRYANRAKGKRTPFEAFGDSPTIDGRLYDWSTISQLAAGLPKNKRWRFQPDARQRFDAVGGFQARQLNETGWLARVAKQYLAAVADPYKIHVLPGRLTAMIRGKWGLNTLLPDHNYSDAKNRKDHRHHAIDAMVAAMTDRSLLHRMSSAYDDERDKIEVPPPWPTVRDDLGAKLEKMIVSHKTDHGIGAQLHEDTAYGAIKEPNREDGNLVYRKSFLGLNENEIGRIRDRRLRDLVRAHVASEKSAGKDLKTALTSFASREDIPALKHGMRHVRLLKSEKPEYLVPIRDKAGRTYKYYSAGENAFVDIVEGADGRWIGKGVTVFLANQRDFRPPQSEGRLVMCVFKGDLLRIDHAGASKLVRIVRLSPSNNVLYLVEHNEAGNFQARHDDPADPFRWLFANFDRLREWKAERVRVDELGRPWRLQPPAADPSP
jgi:CRISPR-associated endonuclease Csn1